jgi:hypothetical protein
MKAGKTNSSWIKDMSKTRKFLGQEIPPMNAAQLRQFGLVFSGIITTLFGFIIPFLFGFDFPIWPWVLAGVVGGMALIYPKALHWFYQLWMRFGIIMNIIMSRLILGTVFVLTVIPSGLIFRLRGKDILDLKTDESRKSYRNELEVRDPAHLRKPY